MSKQSVHSVTVEEFYQQMIGERWPVLRAALLAQEPQVERWNAFSAENHSKNKFDRLSEKKDLRRDSQGLLTSYIMDEASIYAAQCLRVEASDKVLDMCAAPGGKSLILAEQIGGDGELLANEMSEGRRDRLKKVFQQYIPLARRQNMWVTGKDGGLYAKSHAEYFDKILVDAPCSGERYLLVSAKELAEWKPSRSEKIAQRQYALLTAALIACKSGGQIVYSTCAISNLENDEVIKKLIKKKGDTFDVETLEVPVPGAEKTEFGIQLWPDRAGQGPIYYCSLIKK